MPTNGRIQTAAAGIDEILDRHQAELNFPEVTRELKRDLKAAADLLTLDEVRYLVDMYYSMQKQRIGAGGQVRAMVASGESHAVLSWAKQSMEGLEETIKAILDRYSMTESSGMGQWVRQIVGIGPVIACGLLAHFDIEQAPTAGHFWSFAGLDPTKTWNKGEKRPWNADLKVLVAFKAGESFIKFQNHKDDIYGKVFVARRELERSRNEAGLFADQAAAKLEKYKIGHDTDAYKAYSIGKLPPAHIHARARRYAVKLFVAHLWEEMYVRHYKKAPPLPYPIAFQNHTHVIERPNPTAINHD